jgi:hypothetical protein
MTLSLPDGAAELTCLHLDTHFSAEVFEPSVGTWRRWENMRFKGDLRKKCAVSSSRELYAFSDEQQQVMKYYGGEKHLDYCGFSSTICFLH